MLIGSKRSLRKEVLETDMDDVQLLEGDVTVGTEDVIPSIKSSNHVHQILYKSISRFTYRKSVIKAIREIMGRSINLDDNTRRAL
ncbi:hypothetical protein PVK06_008159 [Gossypium arboreum]|uniref:Uncharacterized protein n=1 Tax=Gossypium arboreum TaxID=29729 RepID=A0ABR0QJA4_GOSAR|nr:hypothetical protein PVK06_008159 [Gossypium arboreum]